MYYTVYKVTNTITGKFYVGCHKTNDLADGYMGSGTYLKRSIAKHGVDKFTKDILYIFDTSEDMFAKEAEIVDEDFLAEENTYNLKLGGDGGWDYLNNDSSNNPTRTKEHMEKMKIASMRRFESDPELQEARKHRMSILCRQLHDTGRAKYDGFSGKTHSPEVRKIISENSKRRIEQNGGKTPTSGKLWVYNLELEQCKLTPKTHELESGWSYGKVDNFKKFKEKLEKTKRQELRKKEKQRIKYEEKIQKVRKIYKDYMDSGLSLRQFSKYTDVHFNTLSRWFLEYIKEYSK